MQIQSTHFEKCVCIYAGYICTYVQKMRKAVFLAWLRFRNVSIAFDRFYTSTKVICFIGFITCRAASIILLFVCTF